MAGYRMADYPSDWTPLHIAVWRHDFDMTAMLADSASVNVKDNQGWTPVHLACASSDSSIFSSQQRSQRGYPFNSRQPPRDVSYLNDGDDERAIAMGILEILLRHHPRLDGYDFPTPLHCAANSGWFSHTQALVESGASVYTGPGCSPLCWVHGGSAGHNRVAEYLRDLLGEVGLAMIDEDHIRAGATGLPNPHDRHHPPPEAPLDLPRDPAARRQLVLLLQARHVTVDDNGLCPKCAGMTVHNLCSRVGYLHHPSMAMVRQAAMSGCTFCQIIGGVLDMHANSSEHRSSQVIIRLSNGNNSHRGICTDPPTLRVLQFRLSSHCVCPPRDRMSPRGSLGFNFNCFGGCEGVVVHVDIFADKERKLTIPAQSLPGRESHMKDFCWTVPAGTTVDEDPLSTQVLCTIQEWRRTCQANHLHCRLASSLRNPDTYRLPDRVIDVGYDGMNSIRLYSGPEKHGTYLVLSHRWVTGPTPGWVTNQSSLARRYGWFLLNGLPKSIFDAVRVTRALGFRFLWIDSLCIVQDSTEDWNVQSAQMAKIYANAAITLFADCARDDEAGFLYWRPEPKKKTITIPFFSTQNNGRNDRAQENESLTLHLRHGVEMASQFSKNVDDTRAHAYLADRGWILQERVLSRRILHFGRNQIFWECHEGTFAENGYTVQQRGVQECGVTPDSRFSKLTYSRVLEEVDQPSLPSEEFYKQWTRLIEVYSTLNFTQGKDKLPALSGLAQAFHARTDPENKYICGLWGADIAGYLAWSLTTAKPLEERRVFRGRIHDDGSQGGGFEHDGTFIHFSQLSARPATYRAPSFSWACVDGQIEFHHGRYRQEEVSPLRLEEISTSSSAAQSGFDDPYGKPDEGSVYIDITGPVQRAWSHGPLREDLKSSLYPRKAGYTPLYFSGDSEHVGASFGYVLPDALEPETQQQRMLYCLQLSRSVFLVLVPLQGGDWEDGDWQDKVVLPSFRRVGLGIARNMNGFDDGVDAFSDASMVTIRLV